MMCNRLNKSTSFSKVNLVPIYKYKYIYIYIYVCVRFMFYVQSWKKKVCLLGGTIFMLNLNPCHKIYKPENE
jgi:hypothetical protein